MTTGSQTVPTARTSVPNHPNGDVPPSQRAVFVSAAGDDLRRSQPRRRDVI